MNMHRRLSHRLCLLVHYALLETLVPLYHVSHSESCIYANVHHINLP